MESNTLGADVIAIVAAAVGVTLGIALRWLFGRLRRRASSTSWSGDELILGLLRDLAVPLLTLAGLWVAVSELALRPRWHDLSVGCSPPP